MKEVVLLLDKSILEDIIGLILTARRSQENFDRFTSKVRNRVSDVAASLLDSMDPKERKRFLNTTSWVRRYVGDSYNYDRALSRINEERSKVSDKQYLDFASALIQRVNHLDSSITGSERGWELIYFAFASIDTEFSHQARLIQSREEVAVFLEKDEDPVKKVEWVIEAEDEEVMNFFRWKETIQGFHYWNDLLYESGVLGFRRTITSIIQKGTDQKARKKIEKLRLRLGKEEVTKSTLERAREAFAAHGIPFGDAARPTPTTGIRMREEFVQVNWGDTTQTLNDLIPNEGTTEARGDDFQ